MTSPEGIFTICRRTTASPYYILKSLISKERVPKSNCGKDKERVAHMRICDAKDCKTGRWTI